MEAQPIYQLAQQLTRPVQNRPGPEPGPTRTAPGPNSRPGSQTRFSLSAHLSHSDSSLSPPTTSPLPPARYGSAAATVSTPIAAQSRPRRGRLRLAIATARHLSRALRPTPTQRSAALDAQQQIRRLTDSPLFSRSVDLDSRRLPPSTHAACPSSPSISRTHNTIDTHTDTEISAVARRSRGPDLRPLPPQTPAVPSPPSSRFPAPHRTTRGPLTEPLSL